MVSEVKESLVFFGDSTSWKAPDQPALIFDALVDEPGMRTTHPLKGLFSEVENAHRVLKRLCHLVMRSSAVSRIVNLLFVPCPGYTRIFPGFTLFSLRALKPKSSASSGRKSRGVAADVVQISPTSINDVGAVKDSVSTITVQK